MIGKTILHYKILEKLGEGGMGVVYKAEDTKLKRDVAIKFLPRQIAAGDEERERFKTEAQAAAALNHPNIATVHNIEEVDGDTFIVMEYIKGKELKELTTESGELSIEDVTNYATQIAEGLKAAHEEDVTHRDIKSANIMITEKGQVKVMDFGLAKVRGGAQVTKVGTTLGTAAYMAPEQARGEEADHRSDIWSFGVVLYEMLTGQLPFKGDYEQAVIYSILNEEPEALAEINDELPRELTQLVRKALEKEPDRRYQSMSDLLEDLTKPPSEIITPSKQEKSIVVLPFENISPDPENEYFSDGLTEEIIADLSKIEALRVISRTSAIRLKGANKDIKTIGRELHVQYVLEGSVRKAGNNLRITAQLIDATTDAHLWAEKYSGTLEDVFEIQEKVARSIVDALKLKLAPKEKKELAERPIADVRAYDYYFRARQEILKFSAVSLKKALDLIQKSEEIVGENILLLAARGFVHWMYYNAGIESEEKHLNRAEQCAQRIFELEPESVHGYRLLGLVEAHRNLKEGIRNLERVLELDPNDPDALGWLIPLNCFQGRTAQAQALTQKLMKIDPLTPLNHIFATYPPRFEGRFREAVPLMKKAYELESDNPVYQFLYFYFLEIVKEHDEDFALLHKSKSDMADDFFSQLSYFIRFALMKEKEKALELVTDDFKTIAKNDCEYSSYLAEGYALLDEKTEALDWLENAVNRGYINYPFVAEHDPFLENLRGDKRFEKLMKRVKTEWQKAVQA